MNDEGKISEVLATLDNSCPSCFSPIYPGLCSWKDYCNKHLIYFYTVFNWKTDAPALVEEVKRRGLDV